MRFAELEHADVAVWGYGREGRSVLAALRRRFPDKPLTLFCAPDETKAARARGDANLQVIDAAPDAEALSAHDVVVKSPGISAYKPEILAARERGRQALDGSQADAFQLIVEQASDACCQGCHVPVAVQRLTPAAGSLDVRC